MYSTFSPRKDATWHIYVTPGLVGTPAALPYLAQELLKNPLKYFISPSSQPANQLVVVVVVVRHFHQPAQR